MSVREADTIRCVTHMVHTELMWWKLSTPAFLLETAVEVVVVFTCVMYIRVIITSHIKVTTYTVSQLINISQQKSLHNRQQNVDLLYNWELVF